MLLNAKPSGATSISGLDPALKHLLSGPRIWATRISFDHVEVATSSSICVHTSLVCYCGQGFFILELLLLQMHSPRFWVIQLSALVDRRPLGLTWETRFADLLVDDRGSQIAQGCAIASGLQSAIDPSSSDRAIFRDVVLRL